MIKRPTFNGFYKQNNNNKSLTSLSARNARPTVPTGLPWSLIGSAKSRIMIRRGSDIALTKKVVKVKHLYILSYCGAMSLPETSFPETSLPETSLPEHMQNRHFRKRHYRKRHFRKRHFRKRHFKKRHFRKCHFRTSGNVTSGKSLPERHFGKRHFRKRHFRKCHFRKSHFRKRHFRKRHFRKHHFRNPDPHPSSNPWGRANDFESEGAAGWFHHNT